MERHIRLHDKTGKVYCVNPYHIVMIEATENRPESPATVTMVGDKELRPKETFGEILRMLGLDEQPTG